MAEKTVKTIELWEGFGVKVNEDLFDDFDFMAELSAAAKQNDMANLIEMYMAIVGGEPTYKMIREHIEAEHGRFSIKALTEIIEKIDGVLPKAGNRAQQRSWKTSI